MPQLIINADDLGSSAPRSHGILQCFEFGVVTSATIWPNGSDSTAAARRARERGLPVGLHLNLVEEYPLSKRDDVATLLDANGAFHPVRRFFQLLDEGTVRTEHLEREIRAQIAWCFDQNLSLTHVAGNFDAHVHPAVAHALLPHMERYGIRFVRIPCEEPLPPLRQAPRFAKASPGRQGRLFGYNVSEEQLAEARWINALARGARAIFEAAGIQSTQHFRGHTLLGNASLKNLRHILSRLPEGTTELMVHPGSPAKYGTPFDLDPQRQTELRMLTDPSIPMLIAQRKIQRISYADL